MPSEPIHHHIPFNKPCFEGKELVYIAQAIGAGHISGDGEFTRRCQQLLETELGARKALLTTSCTHALEMAAILLDLMPGDEVIVPSFTFVSTVNAFVLHGARPVFCDIRPDTLNMNEHLLEDLITPRTRAIVPVHYAGVGCEMDAINAIAERHGAVIIEDNAHGLFGRYKGRPLGSFGAMATQSFHETKNITCGEGGALLINDPQYIERAEIIREKGTNRSRFFRGQVDKYSWVDLGSSYLPSDMLAAFLYGQLEVWQSVQHRRRLIWERYREGLSGWARENGAQLPFIPDHCEHASHMFYVILPTLEARQALIAHLKRRGITAVFHYLPLHHSEFARKRGFDTNPCPVTCEISDCLLRLPFYTALTKEEQHRVIDVMREFQCEY
ncbi:MAG: dTDP-4-amino-4,6-dideoxygalactose transaminase [Candidatus Sumerlaeota bacterium]|nr:dTDP-4-amino-4,6-dideoxygalactose transaminase [Candidatus Sumerlaeota bacterium]